MTDRILLHFLILTIVLFQCIISSHGTALALPCDGVLTDTFAVSDDVSFQTAVPADGVELLSQDEVDALAAGFMMVYNQLQGNTCTDETIIVESVEGIQVVRRLLRRNLATAVVTRTITFRIKGTCKACGNKPLLGNDAGRRFLQQQSNKQGSNSNSGKSKINRGQFIKQYRLWIQKEKALGRFQKSKVDAKTILREGLIEIVGS